MFERRLKIFLGILSAVVVMLLLRAAQLQVAQGEELFLRRWTSNDPRSHGGDGLGPVYNALSCVDCHSLGGPGGAGTSGHDVKLIAASARGGDLFNVEIDELARLHPAFRDARSLVLHRFGTDARYPSWRRSVMTEDQTSRSFGTGGVWFPRGLLLRSAARHVCERLIAQWQAPGPV